MCKLERHFVSEFEGWDNSDWGWQDDSEVDHAQNAGSSSNTDMSWLHECLLDLSPAADLMAVGKADRLVLLARKWTVITKYLR